MDPALPVEPACEAKALAAATYIVQDRQFVFDGNIAEALARFEQAALLDPERSLLSSQAMLAVLNDVIAWYCAVYDNDAVRQ